MSISASASFPGNAKVSDGAWIQPAQAFVNAIDSVVGTNANPLNLNSQGITSVTSDIVSNCNAMAAVQSANMSLSLSNNALTSDCVDNLLSSIQTNGYENGSLDISGGTNAPPTPIALHIDAIYTFSFAATFSNGDSFSISNQNNVGSGPDGANVTFSNSTNLSDSTLDMSSSNAGTIGIADSPTSLEVAEKFASLLSDAFSSYGTVTVDGSGLITWTISSDSLIFPGQSQFQSTTNNVNSPIASFNQVQSGQAYEQNGALNSIVNFQGWSVTTN